MQILLDPVLIVARRQDTLLPWVVILSHGVVRSSQLFLPRVLRLSIMLCLMVFVSFFGFRLC